VPARTLFDIATVWIKAAPGVAACGLVKIGNLSSAAPGILTGPIELRALDLRNEVDLAARRRRKPAAQLLSRSAFLDTAN